MNWKTKKVLEVNFEDGSVYYIQNVCGWKLTDNLYLADNFYYDSEKEKMSSIEKVLGKYPKTKVGFKDVSRKTDKDEWK